MTTYTNLFTCWSAVGYPITVRDQFEDDRVAAILNIHEQTAGHLPNGDPVCIYQHTRITDDQGRTVSRDSTHRTWAARYWSRKAMAKVTPAD